MKALRPLFALLFVGCFMPTKSEAVELPPVEVINTPTPAYARNLEVKKQAKSMVAARDTAGLEALASQLRTSRERLDGGTWLLSVFYDTISDLPADPEQSRATVDFYETWARESPESITAQLCLAGVLVDYAWQARGRGWANTVTDEGWRLMRERLEQSWDVLGRAKGLKETCPGWFQIAQGVALGQGWERAEYLEMVDAALQAEPTYGNYITKACYWMIPRWYGEVGDFEAWIAKKADTFPAAERDRQYAFYVWMADQMGIRGEIVFGPNRLDWDRTKRGFENWLKEKPDNLMIRFKFERFALLAGDRQTAREQFDITGGKYFPPAWGGKVRDFEAARKFATENGPNPLASQEPAGRKQVAPEVIAKVAFWCRLFAGFCSGAIAGVFLLIFSVRRRNVKIGVGGLISSIVLATAFGVWATLLPAAAVVAYFVIRRETFPPPIATSSGWIVFLFTFLLAGLNLLLQVGASVVAMVPTALELGTRDYNRLTRTLFETGTALQIVSAAMWLTALGLLASVRPQDGKHWRNTFGLLPTPLLPAVGWTVLASAILFGIGILVNPYLDAGTIEVNSMLALAVQSPISLFLGAVILGPIFEEMLFRGFAFSGWIDRLGYFLTALLTSTLFALAHVGYGWVGLLYIFAVGWVLMTLRWKCRSIYPPVIVHVLHNAASLFVHVLPWDVGL